MTGDPIRPLFVNENMGGHTTLHLAIRTALRDHPDVHPRIEDVIVFGVHRVVDGNLDRDRSVIGRTVRLNIGFDPPWRVAGKLKSPFQAAVGRGPLGLNQGNGGKDGTPKKRPWREGALRPDVHRIHISILSPAS